MVVDTSILVAILTGEPEAEAFTRILEANSDLRFSAASLVEATAVMLGRGGERAVGNLNAYIEAARIEIIAVTASQGRIAQQAYLNFGKGRHPAALNFGDCFAYALSKESSRMLFYKGDDFDLTDVERFLY